MSEKDIVVKQIANIARGFYKYDNLINKANNKNYKDGKIGELIKFDKDNYYKTFNDLISSNNYHILLNDDSLIHFYYEFDLEGNIIKHCLYYIPSPTENIMLFYQDNPSLINDLIRNDIIVDIIELLKKYVRIDYDLEGKKEFVHTSVHMHLGIESDYLRFPLYSKVYPEEFIYFILKYIYKSDDEGLEKLDLSAYKKIELSNEELKRFYINNKLDSNTC